MTLWEIGQYKRGWRAINQPDDPKTKRRSEEEIEAEMEELMSTEISESDEVISIDDLIALETKKPR